MNCFHAILTKWLLISCFVSVAPDKAEAISVNGCVSKFQEIWSNLTNGLGPRRIDLESPLPFVEFTPYAPGPLATRLRNRLLDFRESSPQFFLQPGTAVYRGFSQDGYDELSLVRNLMGDRNFDVRSWAYSTLLKDKLAQGQSIESAIAATDEEIAAKISQELSDGRLDVYASMQRIGTAVGGTTATAINFASRLGGAYDYAKMATIGQANRHTMRPIVLEVKPSSQIGILNDTDDPAAPLSRIGREYHIPSHIPAIDIQGSYFGFPTAHTSKIKWFYIQVVERDANGNAISFSIFSATEKSRDLEKGDKIISISRAASDETKRVPRELEPVVYQLRAGLK